MADQHHNGEQYCRRAITMLWNAMETELWEHFLAKKCRNLHWIENIFTKIFVDVWHRRSIKTAEKARITTAI